MRNVPYLNFSCVSFFWGGYNRALRFGGKRQKANYKFGGKRQKARKHLVERHKCIIFA